MKFAEIHHELTIAGFSIIGLCGDSAGQCTDLRERLELPYPIYSDPKRETISQLSRIHRQEPHARANYRHSVYVLDAERRLRYLYVGTSNLDQPDPGHLAALAGEI